MRVTCNHYVKTRVTFTVGPARPRPGKVGPRPGPCRTLVDMKCGDWNTERAEDFSSWKSEENTWQQVARRAEKMGLVGIHR